jgi:hypothetical protein
MNCSVEYSTCMKNIQKIPSVIIYNGESELCVSLIAASKSIISILIFSGEGGFRAVFKGGFFMTLLHLPLLRFHCVGGRWDGSQVCCDCSIGSRTL